MLGQDTSALPLLVLCLALLGGLTYAVMVARRHLSAVAVWVVALPLVATAAWMTTDVAVRLLPNLI